MVDKSFYKQENSMGVILLLSVLDSEDNIALNSYNFETLATLITIVLNQV